MNEEAVEMDATYKGREVEQAAGCPVRSIPSGSKSRLQAFLQRHSNLSVSINLAGPLNFSH